MQFLRTIFIATIIFTATQVHSADPWKIEAAVHWTQTPLRESLDRFAEAQRIGVVLDRRVDPSQSLQFESGPKPLNRLIAELADSLDLGCCFFETTVYLGPKNAAVAIAALREEHKKTLASLPVRQTAKLQRRSALKIAFLTEPRQLLQRLAEENGFRWKNLDELPHDLWDENRLPPMPIYEQLALILIGFDRTFGVEGDSMFVLRPLPKDLPEVQSAHAEPSISQNEQKTPKPSRNEIPLARRRFTLRVEQQPLDQLLPALAERIGLKLEWDEKSLERKGVSLDKPVSLDVKNATIQELFRAALEPLKLEFQLRGNTIRVR